MAAPATETLPAPVVTETAPATPATRQAQAPAGTPPAPAPEPVAAKPLPEFVPPKPSLRASRASIPHVAAAKVISGAKPGWNCRSGAGQKGWDCALGGADPKGQAHLVSDSGTAMATTTEGLYAFTSQDEARFRDMLTVIGVDPWAASCAKLPAVRSTQDETGDRAGSALEIDSDYSEMEGNELYTFTGGVDLERADQRLLGDVVVHDKLAHTLNAHGDVIYHEKGTTVAADSLFMKMDSGQGKLRNAQYLFDDVPARGKAETTFFDDKQRSRYIKATFTTCRPGNNDWLMHASRLRVDKETGRGVASNAWLEFKGVPFFYTPWISFPTDKRRQSGFTSPNFGLSSGNGFSAAIPYYWNIAPNYDATLYPRYNVNRGMIYGAEARYLDSSGTGFMQGQFMPDDQKLAQNRGFFSFNDSRTLLPNLTSTLRLNYVSDNQYFADMWNTINRHDFLNRSYLPSTAALNYSDTFDALSVYSTVTAANYQVLADNFPDSSKPYRLLPMWSFGLSRPIGVADGVFTLDNELSYFDHDSKAPIRRANIKPSLAFPWQNEWGFLTPKLSLQHTEYWIDNGLTEDPFVDPSGKQVGSVGRTTPIVSLDSGLKFDRDIDLFGDGYTQTLEPRLFYLYLPYSNQNNIPVVNSAQYDITFASLFRENRFAGLDRMGDANQFSLALTSRLIDQTSGREKLRLNLGKMFDVYEPKVNLVGARLNDPILMSLLAGANTNTVNRKDVIAEATAFVTDTLKVTPMVLWNYEDNRADRFQTMASYNAGNNRIFNVGYRYRYGLTDNSDISLSWPITKEWSVVGRWQYAWQLKTSLESFVGVQKETCCWKIGIIARQYMTGVGLYLPGNLQNTLPGTNVAAQPLTNGVFLSLELKGFANIGDSIGHFLSYSIPGYDAD